MAETIGNVTGDGVTANLIQVQIQVPDAGAGNVNFVGLVQAVGQAKQTLTGSPIAMPAVPGSGNVYWQLAANYLTGAVTLLQSTVGFQAMPANNIEVFRQTLPAGTANPSTQCVDATPDTW